MKNYPTASIALLIILFFLSGCAGIAIENLVPEVNPLSTSRFDRSIKILDVNGAQKSFFGGPAMVTNEQFKEALIISLKKSNLFNLVSTDKDSDYELRTEIIAHGQGDGLDFKSAMVIEYHITEAKTKKEVWFEGFNSRHEVTVAEAFSGDTRTVMAQEGSVRKNLLQFVSSLSESKL